jgi:uncharacterized protein (UPF0548 family)
VFTFSRPSPNWIQQQLHVARKLNHPISDLRIVDGSAAVRASKGFAIDHRRSQIGAGEPGFRAAQAALSTWKMFDLGWVWVADLKPTIALDSLVAVVVHSLGLWTVNISRITHVIDEPRRFGFVYSTTQLHVERGEERFLLEWDPATDAVFYDLLAVSQPAHPLATLGYPITRHFQHKFARTSHQRMSAAATAI